MNKPPEERAKDVTTVSSAEHTRRDFLYIATGAIGAVGAAAVLVPLIAQMQAALPRAELNLLQLRASEVMRAPGQDMFPVPQERQLTPIKPLLELRF